MDLLLENTADLTGHQAYIGQFLLLISVDQQTRASII